LKQGGAAPAPRANAPAKPPRKRKAPSPITPEQALEQARMLLEQKQEHDRQPAPWQQLDHEGQPTSQASGFVSAEAAVRANELHAAESRLKAIQGSSGTQDRRNQGKRDHRGE
jgi:hypothetical protein